MIEDVPGTFVPGQEPVACPECGHITGEEGDLLTIAYMAGAYDERKSRENAGKLRAPHDLAERAAVVAYLRAYAKEMEEYHSVVPGFLRGAADAIEQGAHLGSEVDHG